MVASRWCNHFQWHWDWNLFGPIGFLYFLVLRGGPGSHELWKWLCPVATGTGRSKMRGPLRRRRHAHTRSEHRL